jgi:hypothetical protein
MPNNVHNGVSAVALLPADVQAATRTTNDFDISKYVGVGKLVLDAEAQGSGVTNTVKIQASDLAAGAAYSSAAGADLDLLKSTGSKTKLGVKFTQSGARQIKSVTLLLKKTGTIASDKVLTVTIQGHSSTVPDGTPIGTAGTVLANTIDTAYQPVKFTFDTPVTVADSTVYWICIEGNYSASDSNFISWSTETVVSGGTAATYAPSSWTALTTSKPQFTSQQYNFTDVTGGAFSAVGNTAETATLALNLDAVGSGIRAVSTVAGGSSTGALSLILLASEPQT